MNMRLIFCCVLVSLVLAACGSGGGGGDSFDPLKGATVELITNPRTIGLGDRTLLSIAVSRVHPQGAMVVVRHTFESLAYVPSTATLIVGRNRIPIGPAFGPGARARFSYLTFYIPESAVGEDRRATLELQLRGERRDSEARVDIDEFLFDPTKSPQDQFSLNNPLFSSDDGDNIEIRRP